MEPNRNNDSNNPNKKPNGGDRPKNNIVTALLITLVIVLLFSWVFNTVEKSQYTETTWNEFKQAKDAGQLAEVEIRSDRILFMTKEEAAKDPSQQKACYTGLPTGGDKQALSDELEDMGLDVERLTPRRKDWNDDLCVKFEKHKEDDAT